MNRNNQAEQMKAPGFWYTFLHTIKASFLSRDTILIFAGAIAFYQMCIRDRSSPVSPTAANPGREQISAIRSTVGSGLSGNSG